MVLRTTLLALGLVLVSSTAAADIAPDPSYVETCTASAQQKPGTECYACGSYFRTVDKCSKLLAAHGLSKVCQSAGASVWTEVWCRPAGGAPLPAEVAREVEAATPAKGADGAVPPGHSGCGACEFSGRTSAVPLGLLVAVLFSAGLLRRRPQKR